MCVGQPLHSVSQVSLSTRGKSSSYILSSLRDTNCDTFQVRQSEVSSLNVFSWRQSGRQKVGLQSSKQLFSRKAQSVWMLAPTFGLVRWCSTDLGFNQGPLIHLSRNRACPQPLSSPSWIYSKAPSRSRMGGWGLSALWSELELHLWDVHIWWNLNQTRRMSWWGNTRQTVGESFHKHSWLAKCH